MKTIIGILVLAAVVFAGVYFLSDPFRTRVDRVFESATTWTDENIAQDPEGYLHWTLSEFERMESELRGVEVNLRTQLNSLERRREADAARNPAVETKLEELKSTYREASSTGEWPAAVSGLQVDEEELRRLILEADQHLARYAENERRYQVAIPRTEADLRRVAAVLAELRERRSEVNRKVREVRLGSTLEGIDTLNDRINALLDTSRAVRSETEATLSLDDLIDRDASEVETRRFEEIMSRE